MLYLTEQELLQQLKQEATREKAFRNVVEAYQEKLYWHIRRIVIDHENTNDVLQNTFMKAWSGLENFREDSKLFTWIYRIATNECLAFLAYQKKRAIINANDNGIDLTNKVIAEKNFDGNQLAWKLILAVQKLPEKQRLIFNLRYFDKLSYDEISNILKTSKAGLKTNYHLAVKKIEMFIRNQPFIF